MNPVSVDPQIMHGVPCFTGTRVPIEALFDHLRLGSNVADFLHQFPSVKREHVDAFLQDVARAFSGARAA